MDNIQVSVGTVDGKFDHAVVVPPRGCGHELVEKTTACADGYCPLCSAAKLTEIARLLEFVPGINDERDSIPLLHAVKAVIEGIKK